MYVLDTDIMTLAHGGHPGIGARMRQAGEENLATTVINAIEILQGRHGFMLKAKDGEELLHAQQLLDSSEAMLQATAIISVDIGAAAVFDRLRLDKKLKKIGRSDLLITCIALAQRATLVSRNLRHFRQVPGLQVENWAD